MDNRAQIVLELTAKMEGKVNMTFTQMEQQSF